MTRLTVPVTRLRPDAILPTAAHGPEEDAGLDLFAVEEVTLPSGGWAGVVSTRKGPRGRRNVVLTLEANRLL